MHETGGQLSQQSTQAWHGTVVIKHKTLIYPIK
ncbi:hypothetical protein SNOG_20082 [Parastagonospora nodorum SN15]|uniref:Uncharacterized protein n=1 Tax=Phaeosphaeria nodorum (strain SN15 / ATCC MYA-4574 / FGSC 10173) TaxID=321614 RepID=A9JX80_PHANO|nr:hypothetical protein SNOG_20082 [Parastagonospora nodorum SN15]EDP89771.1 hypothetical protein SNOG_20082 [Parastagonospora nodorum SN15]